MHGGEGKAQHYLASNSELLLLPQSVQALLHTSQAGPSHAQMQAQTVCRLNLVIALNFDRRVQVYNLSIYSFD